MDLMDGMEESGVPLVAPRLVVDGEGVIATDYAPQLLTTSLGVTIQCILVSEVGDRFLVAFPHLVWHRQPTKRVLPAQFLSKPTLMEVACCALVQRAEIVEDVLMKIWVGYVTAENYRLIVEMEEGATVDYPFVIDGERDYLPFAQSLVDALQDHFAFLSAESGAPGGLGGAGAAEPLSQPLDARVANLEDNLEKISNNMEELLMALQQRGRAPRLGEGRVTFDPTPKVVEAKVKKKPKPAVVERFPQLDPSVVSAALCAGVSESNLEEMQRLIAGGQVGSRRLREPALRSPARRAEKDVLSESEDEAEEDDVDGGSAGVSAPPSVESAVSKLTELVSLLAADRVKKAKGSKIDQALDNVGSTMSSEASGGGQMKRAAAARRALRQALQETPEEISGVVEKLLLEDLTSQTQAHGMPAVNFNARAWVEHRSRISSSYKTSAHVAWSAAGILDNLVKGRVAQARAQAGLLLLQLDQVAIDRGSWSLAAELALEQGPPLASLSMHSLPNVGEGESPFSRLLDPRWSEVMLSHLKDAEDYVQKRRSLGKKLGTDESHTEPSKPKAKAKAKGKGQEPVDA